MKRREFLKTAGLATGTAAAAAATSFPAPAIAQGKRTWKMVSPWPRNAPGVGVNAQRVADALTAATDGRITIQHFAGGELVPPFECFDAVQGGAADIAHGTPYYWVGKSKALNYFTTIPFGMTAVEMASWLRFGDGQALWDEAYGQFGMKGFYAGSSGVQSAGWFAHEVNSLDDLKGLKMRIAGLGGEVMRRLGVSVVLMPPGDIFGAMQSGAVDAAEWVGPWNDLAFGLYKAAKYYYMPAFHEPGPALEVFMKKETFEDLPKDLQVIVETVVRATAMETLADFTYHNIDSLQSVLEKEGVQLRRFSPEIVDALGKTTKEVLTEIAATDELTGKIHASFMDFMTKANAYAKVMDQPMLEDRARVWG
ncbi:TRAP transporter substrate-binding protein [Aestuariispira ectoiniformans]|uniref:TRAP transporter substrate-binding protein n=1 Tax=Aestuariispira ectoiniformans TaxID=2775080 RepID=UPI00223B55BF|nr:TRAP transporter substrate-binding protein [Aestuariispira ectoiniformans]